MNSGTSLGKAMFKNIKLFCKNNSLFICIAIGWLWFALFHYIPQASSLKPLSDLVVDTLPVLLFTLLFFSFCKLNFHEMRPKRWHLILAAIQIVSSTLLVVILYYGHLEQYPDLAAICAGVLVCTISPTAASAAVMTGKLGGNESSQTTYTLISNLIAALFIPLLFPLICANSDNSFWHDFVLILNKTFPILVLPLILAIIIKRYFPKILGLILSAKNTGFYCWLMTVTIQSSRIFDNVASSRDSTALLIELFVAGLVITLLQYFTGKRAGLPEGQPISAGQGLGQKNTVFSIWIALIYLSPTIAIVPSSYMIWQNIFNALQMRYTYRKNQKRASEGLPELHE